MYQGLNPLYWGWSRPLNRESLWWVYKTVRIGVADHPLTVTTGNQWEFGPDRTDEHVHLLSVFRLFGFAFGKIDSLWSRWRSSPFVWQASWQRWREINPWRRYCWKSVSWKQRWHSSIIWLRSWRKIDDFRQKPQSMRRSPNWRRLTRDLVEPSIPHGSAFAELWSCSCMPASLCSRQVAAVQRTPPTSWWRILSTFAAGHWVGGVLVGLLPMANSMATASSELTVSLAPVSTLEMLAAEWSLLWNATLMAANQPCWAGSSSASVYP